jgi:hypothetical protein
MLKRLAIVSLVLAGLCQQTYALEFQPVGNGALGVGGAGIARTEGAMSAYWNPAGLAFAQKTVSVSLSVGAGLSPDKNLAQDLDNLSTKFDAWNSNQTDTTAQTNLANAVALVPDSDNLRATASTALGVQVKQVGFGVFGTFEGGATPHLSPVVQNGNLTDFTDSLRLSTVSPRGILLLEAPLSYGYNLDLGNFGHMGLGLTGKYLYGEVTSSTVQIFDTANGKALSSKDLTKDLSKNRHGSSSWGIDLGVLWKPEKLLPVPVAVGIVAKNLNAPSFSSNTGYKIKVDPQVRAGFVVSPLSWFDIVADIDVIENPTVIPGLKSQQFGGGAEFKPFSSLKLRVGGYTDISQSNGAITAGLSLGIPSVFLDIDGAYGLGTVKYDNESYPSEAKVQVSLNVAF